MKIVNLITVPVLLFATTLAAEDNPLAEPHPLPYETILPDSITEYEIMQADSGGPREYFLTRSVLTTSGVKLQGKKGRSCADVKPWLLIRHRRTLKGLAIFLAYPGNWWIEVDAHNNRTRLRANTWPENLPQIETVNGLPVPGCLVVKFKGHWDNGAQPIVRFVRHKLLRKLDPDWPWIQFNNYYDRYGVLQQDRMIACARQAAKLGCELFVIDAGWFGSHLDWHHALGDWHVNTEMLPNGIKPIEQAVRSAGMKFGLWVEIEGASPKSQLVKKHPHWLMRSGGKLASQRSFLNFGNPQVVTWAKAVIDKMVTDHRLDYIKMDSNAEPIFTGDRDQQGNERLWAHCRGMIELWKYMRAKYPNLIIENCAGGSKRADLSAAAHTDTHWVSDSIKGQHMLAANFAATYLFPPEFCSHWTGWPHTSPALDLQTEFTVNLLGMPGLSGAIVAWDDQILFHAADRIALYKLIRPWIKNSQVYHLTQQVNPEKPQSLQAIQYLDPDRDRSLLFIFRAGDPTTKASFKLKGLKPNTNYQISMPPLFGRDSIVRGQVLARGLSVDFPQHTGASAVMRIQPAGQTSSKPLPAVNNFKAAPIPLYNARDQLALLLTWNPIPGAQRYVIYLSQKGQSIRPIDETFLTRYIAAGLKEDTDYDVQVVAESFDGKRKSHPSEIVTAKTRSLCLQNGKLWNQPWRIDQINFFNIHTKRNRAVLGDQLSIRSHKYRFGIGTHAGSKFIFDLTRIPADRRRKFSATIGIDDCALYNMKKEPACIFIVATDQRELYRSNKLTEKDDPVDIQVPLPAATEKLILGVKPVTESPFNHADWINPKIE
ncbi:MAG: alpha-galactosidase [Planctomycetota bacterium]|jgi:alpha-galactosidase